MGKVTHRTKTAPGNDVYALKAAIADPPGSKKLRLGVDCDYEKELRRLQVEFANLPEWIRHKGLKLVVIFEGRDGAGKGGAIKRITDSLNPRICRIVALPAPT